MARALHIGREMKTTLLLAISLFTACTDAAPTEAASDTEVTQNEAAALCATDLHLPTEREMTEILNDCVATSRGWECKPCDAGTCAERFGEDLTVSLGRIWSSTPCSIEGGAGFFVADLELGHIVCAQASEAKALPLCVR